jgi:hypothetical protein
LRPAVSSWYSGAPTTAHLQCCKQSSCCGKRGSAITAIIGKALGKAPSRGRGPEGLTCVGIVPT